MIEDQTSEMLDETRKRAMLKYVSEGATSEDLEAAGYTPKEISIVFPTTQQASNTTSEEFNRDRQDTISPDTLESYTPTYRDSLRAGIEKGASALGAGKQTRQLVSDRLIGSQTSGEMGLLDLTGPAAIPGIQEGVQQAKRGYASGSKSDMALGTLGVGLNVLSAIPGGRVIAKGVTKGTEKLLGKLGAEETLRQAPKAVIRPDNLFRGEGPVSTSLSVATKPYAVRLTGQSQIDDMVKSGLVRPKVGGYGKAKKSTLYFGEMEEATPNSVFTRPTESSGKEYTIVAKSSQVAGREGPIPIDELQHIWTMRNGKMVDILPEVLKKNIGYTPAGFAQGGSVEDNQMNRLMQEGGIADSGISNEPVTGNEIPPGSMASEVRDDIPTQLSEGEYVVPADVVRFFGVRFFEDLRSKAKQGLSQMEADGRIGGAPVDASGIPMQAEEDQLTPEEEQMLTEALGSTGMAFGGMVGQMPFNMQEQPPSNPYKDQSTMYNMPMGMADGGDLGFDRTQFQVSSGGSYGIESRKYINPNTGEIRYFNFMEGNQLGIIPEGFVAWTAELQQTAQDTGATTTDEVTKPAVRTRTSASVTPVSVSAEADNEGGTANYESWADKNYEEITSNPYQFGIDALNKTKGKGLAKGIAGVGLMAGSPLLTAAGGVLNLSNKINNIASANAALKVMASQGLTGTTEYKNLESSIKSAASDIPLANWGFVGQGENYYQAVKKKADTPVTAPVARSSGASTASSPAKADPAKADPKFPVDPRLSIPPSSNKPRPKPVVNPAAAPVDPRLNLPPALPQKPIVPKPVTAAQSGQDALEGRRARGGLVTKRTKK